MLVLLPQHVFAQNLFFLFRHLGVPVEIQVTQFLVELFVVIQNLPQLRFLHQVLLPLDLVVRNFFQRPPLVFPQGGVSGLALRFLSPRAWQVYFLAQLQLIEDLQSLLERVSCALGKMFIHRKIGVRIGALLDIQVVVGVVQIREFRGIETVVMKGILILVLYVEE